MRLFQLWRNSRAKIGTVLSGSRSITRSMRSCATNQKGRNSLKKESLTCWDSLTARKRKLLKKTSLNWISISGKHLDKSCLMDLVSSDWSNKTRLREFPSNLSRLNLWTVLRHSNWTRKSLRESNAALILEAIARRTKKKIRKMIWEKMFL